MGLRPRDNLRGIEIMNKRISTSLLAVVITLAAFVLSGKQSEQIVSAAPVSSYDLLSTLPASDFIIYVDTQRALTEVIPAILIEQPEVRARLESEIDKVKKHVGFDPRLIDAIAVGFNFNSQSAPGASFAVIARGRFDANAAIESGLTAATKESRGELTRRTEVYEGRTMHLLGPARQGPAGVFVERNAPNETENRPSDQTMVFVALDSNTVAFGNLKSVRATIDASHGLGRVSDELVQLATRTPNAAVCFGGKVPADMVRNIRLGNKEAESSIASIQSVYGSFDIKGSEAETLVNIRMEASEDARRVSLALNALEFIAKIGATEGSPERKSIEALIRNVEIYAVDNEVQITARVALTDLAPFLPKH